MAENFHDNEGRHRFELDVEGKTSSSDTGLSGSKKSPRHCQPVLRTIIGK